MRRALGRLLLLGLLAGGVVAARGYLKKATQVEEVVEIVFDDGSTRALASDTAEAQELAEIARKVHEIGV